MAKTKEKEKTFFDEVLSWIVYLAFVIAITFFIITFVGQRTVVDGSSMETTLSDGDNLIVDKLSYRFKDPERFDIIIFPYAYEEDTYFIKRIIGMPGDTIQIKDGYVYINDELLETDVYGAEVIEEPGMAVEPITLGDDEYFVMGDNRNHSEDSRFSDVGVLTKDDLIGKAFVRLYPFDKAGLLEKND